ncbi:MAG: hypothetical protein L6R28_04620 [Planctomycetes bacterium]|nr:hypothetical protein [Planctomycetota bacterium]
MTLRRHVLSAAAILLGAFMSSECARWARADHEADEREARGAQLTELHDALADLESDDAMTREAAQERILALGYSFDDDVAVAFATTQSLEVKVRLTEVLDRWNQQMLEEAIEHVGKSGYSCGDRRIKEFQEHARTCSVCLLQNSNLSSATFMYVSSTTTTTSGAPPGSTGASSGGGTGGSCGWPGDWGL